MRAWVCFAQGIRAKPICQILKVLSDGAKVMIYSHTDKKRKWLNSI